MPENTNQTALATYRADDGTDVALTQEVINYYFCDGANPADAARFAATCNALKLNPFLGDVSLVKHNPRQPAAIIVGKQALAKRADRMADYRGIRHGLVVLKGDGDVEHRKGKALYPGEELLGAWAEVLREGREPYYEEVALGEYQQTTRDRQTGEVRPTAMWARMPAVMIDKVAQATAYRSAYPDEMSGLYDAAEFGEAGMAAQRDTERRLARPAGAPMATVPAGPVAPAPEPAPARPSEADAAELRAISEAIGGDKATVAAAWREGGMEAARALAPKMAEPEPEQPGADEPLPATGYADADIVF